MLDGGEDSTPEGRREAQRSEVAGRIEVVLAGLVDHPQLMVGCGVPVGEDLVDLPALQGHFVALVPEAEHQLRSRSSHVSQDNA